MTVLGKTHGGTGMSQFAAGMKSGLDSKTLAHLGEVCDLSPGEMDAAIKVFMLYSAGAVAASTKEPKYIPSKEDIREELESALGWKERALSSLGVYGKDFFPRLELMKTAYSKHFADVEDCDTKDDVISKYQITLAKSEAREKGLTAEIEKLKGTVKYFKGAIENAKRLNNDLETSYNKMRDEMYSLKRKLASAEDEVATLRSQAAAAKHRLKWF